MNHVIEYLIRGVVRSEDAICRANKRVANLAKCCKRANLCIGGACLIALAVVYIQDREIKALQKQVDDLAAKVGVSEEQKGA